MTIITDLSRSGIARAFEGCNGAVIFGAGLYGRRLAGILTSYGYPVFAFADNNRDLWGNAIERLPVLSPEEAGRRFGREALFLSGVVRYSLLPESVAQDEVVQPLSECGCKNIGLPVSLHELVGRYDCENAGVRLDQDLLTLESYVLPNFFLSPDASIRNNFGLVLSEIFAQTDPKAGTFFGYAYDLPGMTELRPGDTVIDCGANLGTFSAYAASRGCMVHAFEPLPQLAQLLEQTSRLYPGRIRIHQMAVSDKEGRMSLAASELNAAWNMRGQTDAAGNPANHIIVKTAALDEIHGEWKRVDFIKADIEGDERTMVRGAKMTLAGCSPKLALSSYHLPDDPQVLEMEILAANPKYRVRHLADKLYAWTEN